MFIRYNWNKSRMVKRTRDEVIMERNTIRGQRGQVVVVVTISLLVLLGFVGLAVDVGNLFVVRNELQNGADAAALTIASRLYPPNGTEPNWSAARTYEHAALTMNNAANAPLTDGQVTYGYWNITGSPTGLQSTSITPGPNNLPAVKVTISKASDQNGGGVATFFARVLGINSLDASATAVAVVASLGNVGPGMLLPFVISQCMYDNYWDSTNNTPKTSTYNGILQNSGFPIKGKGPIETIGKPYVFWVTSSYHVGTCEAGQWSALNRQDNSEKNISEIIEGLGTGTDSPNNVPLSIGDDVWLSTGTMTAAYENKNKGSINNCSAAGDKSCEWGMVPVVQDPSNTGAWNKILAFACIHIDLANGGGNPGKYIQVEMVAAGNLHCKFPNTGGSGPNYGAYLPPKLANYSGNTY